MSRFWTQYCPGSFRLNCHTVNRTEIANKYDRQDVLSGASFLMAISFASPNVCTIYEDRTNEKVSSEHEKKNQWTTARKEIVRSRDKHLRP